MIGLVIGWLLGMITVLWHLAKKDQRGLEKILDKDLKDDVSLNKAIKKVHKKTNK